MNPFWCFHPHLIEDDDGRAICVACLSVITTRLTRAMLDEHFEQLKRTRYRS